MRRVLRQVGWSALICGTLGLASLVVGVVQTRISGTSWVFAFGPGIIIITLVLIVVRHQVRRAEAATIKEGVPPPS